MYQKTMDVHISDVGEDTALEYQTRSFCPIERHTRYFRTKNNVRNERLTEDTETRRRKDTKKRQQKDITTDYDLVRFLLLPPPSIISSSLLLF